MPVHQRPNRERYRPSATTTLETIPALPISSALFKLKNISNDTCLIILLLRAGLGAVGRREQRSLSSAWGFTGCTSNCKETFDMQGIANSFDIVSASPCSTVPGDPLAFEGEGEEGADLASCALKELKSIRSSRGSSDGQSECSHASPGSADRKGQT